VPGSAYTAADGGPFVGALDIASGAITPIVTGLIGPGGLVFVTSPDDEAGDSRQDQECGRR
jgi:hypothetical protein